jgi:hypothetical protein
MQNEELIQTINTDLAITLSEKISAEALQAELSTYIDHLIKTDFEKLVALLYRIDVNEEKLKYFLIDHPNEDAGNTIAALIIERQLQKIKFRSQFKQDNNNFSEEEKW